MARQDLRALGPACLQRRADRFDDRPSRRAVDRGVAEGDEGQSRAQARGRRSPASEGVYAGECDLAIGNTYYMGAMLKNDKEPVQKEWANSVNMLFPNTNERGTHVNLSGAVLAKNAPHR